MSSTAHTLDVMNPVRPTLRVLRKQLEREQFGDPKILDDLDAAIRLGGNARTDALNDLNILSIEHKLLTDANARFETDETPDRHHKATKAYGSTVYEVRSHIGAAWRGAVILDSDGDPWLIYAAPHDEFHAQVATALHRPKTKPPTANIWEPSSIDIKMKKAEAERVANDDLSRRVLVQVIDAIRDAVDTGAKVELVSPAHWDAEMTDPTVAYSVDVVHEEAAEDAVDAHKTNSEITVVVSLSGANQKIRDILASAACFLQPDEGLRTVGYSTKNEQVLSVMVTHARLAQLLGNIDDPDDGFPGPPSPPTRRHWFTKNDQVRGFVDGDAVTALCGGAYVLSQGEDAALPICDDCEKVKPVAQGLLDHLRVLEAAV